MSADQLLSHSHQQVSAAGVPARPTDHLQLAQASPDLLRELLQTFINVLLSAEAHGNREVPSGVRIPVSVSLCDAVTVIG